MDIIDRIYDKISLEEGKNTIEDFFLQLYFKERMSTKELSQELLIPIPLVTAIKKESIKENMIEQNSGISLSQEGKEFVENILGYKGINKKVYKNIINNNFDEKIMREVYDELELIFKNRPMVDVTIDQSKCTVETAVKRVIIALKNNAIIGKKIVCIGDDDLISISINLILKKIFNNSIPYNTKIYVLDKDKRIIEYINKISEMFDLSLITCREVDFKKKMLKDNTKCFDTVFTDPPYTVNGMELFITRGIEGLKKETGLNIFLSYAHKSQDSMYKIESKILELGLSIYQIIPNFNEYEGAEILGNRGQMLILKTTSNENMAKNIGKDYEGVIYTGEVKQTKRKYKCKNCGKEYFVGIEEKITTIEQLKQQGCQVCYNNIFELVEKVRKE